MIALLLALSPALAQEEDCKNDPAYQDLNCNRIPVEEEQTVDVLD